MSKGNTIGVAIGAVILAVFLMAVTAGALEVKQLPSQPELKVQEARSVFYEDGSIDLQPASKTAGQQLQNTVHARDLQGN